MRKKHPAFEQATPVSEETEQLIAIRIAQLTQFVTPGDDAGASIILYALDALLLHFVDIERANKPVH